MFRLLQWLIRLEWPMRLLDPAFGRYNPFRPGFRDDPYPTYRALREASPVYRHPVLRAWILTRHADVEHVLRAPHFSVDRTQTRVFKAMDLFRGARPEFVRAIQRALLMVDPPDHTRLRGLVNRAFTPRAIERLRPRIREIVEERVDRLVQLREFDLVRELAVPLPVTAIAELLGLPTADAPDLKRWSNALAVLVDPLQTVGGVRTVEPPFLEMRAYFLELFAKRRAQPRDDLVSALVAVEQSDDRLDEDELVALVALLMGAGHETTTNLIGNAVVSLLRNPAERRRLQDDPGLIESAVEEVLRFESPVQVTDRVALEDCEIGGKPIAKGELVGTILGAANRDPERFPAPDRFDVGRADNRHLAFGHGVHFCLGARLARMEAQLAIGTLLERMPDLTGDAQRVEWTRSLVLRGPTELHIRAR